RHGRILPESPAARAACGAMLPAFNGRGVMQERTMRVVALVLSVGVVVASTSLPGGAQTRRPQVPHFEPDPLWSELLPNNWVTGAVGGIAVDSHDNVWVFQRPGSIPEAERAASLSPPQAECCIPAPPVLEFAPNGKFLQAWGGQGAGYEWFRTEHGIFIDADDNV